MKFLVYDLEIKKAIPCKDKMPIEGIEYCHGWRDYQGMGISCCCVYTSEDGKYHVFTDDNKEDFFRLVKETDLSIGWNTLNFDNKVIQSVWGDEFAGNFFDIRQKIAEQTTIWKTSTLSDLCEHNLNLKKIEKGDMAPILFQRGRIGQLINYCINDVFLTLKLYEFIVKTGRLFVPKIGQEIELNLEVSV